MVHNMKGVACSDKLWFGLTTLINLFKKKRL